MRSSVVALCVFAACLEVSCHAPSSSSNSERTPLKPGWNMFTPAQDVALGKRAAADAQKQLPSCNSPKIDAYLTALGARMTAHVPTGGMQYPWEFHCVNLKSINAFALPGGFIFVNRGAIEAVDNESQLAGVLAHELAHVALRHGTNQATKAQGVMGVFGSTAGVFSDSAGGSLITGLGVFAAGGVLLRYSRSAESEADVMGAQVLYDSGYDPRELSQFFAKLDAETKEKSPAEFLSDHPSPEHRVERVVEEIQKLGGVPANPQGDWREFEAIKAEAKALPVVKKGDLRIGGPAFSIASN